MTLDDVAKLDLTPVTAGRLSFNSEFPNAVGIDSTGTRIKFMVSVIDRQAISQLQKKLRTICSLNIAWLAYTKASDGRRIQIALYPRLVDGKSQIAVVEIRRTIPKITTAAQKKEYDEQLREKYGDLYDSHMGGPGLPVKKVQVQIQRDFNYENVITLSMPSDVYSTANKEQLMGQAGCTEKLKVD
ncbi:MAG TPA: hypothetical protein VFF26_04315 [Gallionella sp.]|nr:hypothetical protein [Gallionella sp.]